MSKEVLSSHCYELMCKLTKVLGKDTVEKMNYVVDGVKMIVKFMGMSYSITIKPIKEDSHEV